MMKKVLFSNKMLVLLQKYTKKGETHTLPLAFPPFWAYSMSCFETILFRHSGFPGTANAPPWVLCPTPFGVSQTRAALRGGEKPDLFPAYAPPGPNDSKPSASGGMCPLDKGRTRVLYCHWLFPCMGQPNPGHSLRGITRKRPFTPAAVALAGRARAIAAKWRCDPLPRRPAL